VVQTYVPTDFQPKGLSAGDHIRMTDRLYNLSAQFGKPRGSLVGSDSGTMKIRTGKRTADFRGVARLPGGTIAVGGRVSLTRQSSTVPVVGGTGHFAHARGTVVVSQADNNGRANVFRLTLP